VIEKRSSAFDLVAFTAENRRPLFRKMLCVDWNYLDVSRIWREKYIEFLKLREIAPIYTFKLREFPDQILASQDFSRTPQRPNKTNPARRWRTGSDIPLKDAYSYLSYVSIARVFSTFLARHHPQPKAPLAWRSRIGPMGRKVMSDRTLGSIAQKYRER
jgi:hypothetical protein